MSAGMTHNELLKDLASHLRASGDRMVWMDTQLGPSGSPRPDLFVVNKSFARFHTAAYEVKANLADLRRDITSGKWQSYRKFSHAVWFAFPSGLAPVALIPKECGLILRGENGWRTQRRPIAQVLDTLPHETWIKLLLEGTPREELPRPRIANEWAQQQMLRKKLGDSVADLFSNRQRAEWRLQRAIDERDAAANQIEKETAASVAMARRASEQLDDAMRNLADALGMDPRVATARTLTRRLHEVARSFDLAAADRFISDLHEIKSAMAHAKARAPASSEPLVAVHGHTS